MREAVKEDLKTYFYFRKEEKFMEKIVFQWVREYDLGNWVSNTDPTQP